MTVMLGKLQIHCLLKVAPGPQSDRTAASSPGLEVKQLDIGGRAFELTVKWCFAFQIQLFVGVVKG